MQDHSPSKSDKFEKLIKNLKDTMKARGQSLEMIINTARIADVVLRLSQKLKFFAIEIRKRIDNEKKILGALEMMVGKLVKFEKSESTQEEQSFMFNEGLGILDAGKRILLADSTININIKMLDSLDEMAKVILNKQVPKDYQARNGNDKREHKESKERAPAETSMQIQLQPQPQGQGQGQKRAIGQKCSNVVMSKGKPFSIKKMREEFKDPKKCAAMLLVSDKKCERCLSFAKHALILGFDCVMCIKCVKHSATINGRMISNLFDAHRDKIDTVCVCPSHGSPISPQTLQKLFGGKALEEAVLAAVKSQFKDKKFSKMSRPIICAECKIIVQHGTDRGCAKAICKRHRLCTVCFK